MFPFSNKLTLEKICILLKSLIKADCYCKRIRAEYSMNEVAQLLTCMNTLASWKGEQWPFAMWRLLSSLWRLVACTEHATAECKRSLFQVYWSLLRPGKVLKKSLPTAFLADIRSKVERKEEEKVILLEDFFFKMKLETRRIFVLCSLSCNLQQRMSNIVA